jgi:phosphoglycolate phosphatase
MNGAQATLAGKPSADSLVRLIEPNFPSIPRHKMLMVGDSLKADKGFSDACGFSFCWASYGYGSKDPFDAVSTGFTIDAFEAVLGVVDECIFGLKIPAQAPC